LKKII